MGFGILFFGYFLTFAFSISQMYFFADIIGALIMLYAFSKLTEFNKSHFPKAMIAVTAFLVFCAVNAASMMLELFEQSSVIGLTVNLLKSVSAALVHVFMLLGTRRIAGKANAGGIVKSSNRNLSFILIYYAVFIVMLVIGKRESELYGYTAAFLLIYWLICFILNMMHIYKCFGYFYSADEDQNEKKRSKFAILNKMSDKMDEFEENSNKYRRESIKMARDEAERAAAEKRLKKHPNHVHGKKKK